MITLKKHLEENNLIISDAQRFDLGYKLAREWDRQKRGEKTYTLENDFKVRTYPKNFLYSKKATKLILDYLLHDSSNPEFDNLSNIF